MVEEKVTIVNEVGLHARPASIFLKEAIKYDSEVTLIKDGKQYNGKSIMSILNMQAYRGSEIVIRCEGKDEEEALKNLVYTLENDLFDI